MSSQDQAAALLMSVVFSFDGAVLGVALAYTAVRSVLRFRSNSSALHKLQEAPSLGVSDLRSILSQEDSGDSSSSSGSPSQLPSFEGKLVIVRGIVEAKSSVDANWNILKPNLLISQESGDKAVIIQRTQTCLYNEWKGFLGWTSDLRTILSRSWRQRESSSTRMIPFVLVESSQRRNDYVIVDMDGSGHALPLTTVYHQLQPINPSPYTLLQALFGHEYPVGLLDEEKILPVGKEVNAAGLCILRNGILEIKSCKDLPYFL
jgi:E3 ubiquitin-protein ligase MUL1